eukprot:g18347.t1
MRDPSHFRQALARSFECRKKYDKGQNSEPLMLRNLFIAWLKGLDVYSGSGETSTDRPANNNRQTESARQRYLFIQHSNNFARKESVVPKRLTNLALQVIDVCERVLHFVEGGPAVAIRKLLVKLGRRSTVEGGRTSCENNFSVPDVADIFIRDNFLLRTALVAACSPQICHGTPDVNPLHLQAMLGFAQSPGLKNPFRACCMLPNLPNELRQFPQLLQKSFAKAFGECRQIALFEETADALMLFHTTADRIRKQNVPGSGAGNEASSSEGGLTSEDEEERAFFSGGRGNGSRAGAALAKQQVGADINPRGSAEEDDGAASSSSTSSSDEDNRVRQREDSDDDDRKLDVSLVPRLKDVRAKAASKVRRGGTGRSGRERRGRRSGSRRRSNSRGLRNRRRDRGGREDRGTQQHRRGGRDDRRSRVRERDGAASELARTRDRERTRRSRSRRGRKEDSGSRSERSRRRAVGGQEGDAGEKEDEKKIEQKITIKLLTKEQRGTEPGEEGAAEAEEEEQPEEEGTSRADAGLAEEGAVARRSAIGSAKGDGEKASFQEAAAEPLPPGAEHDAAVAKADSVLESAGAGAEPEAAALEPLEVLSENLLVPQAGGESDEVRPEQQGEKKENDGEETGAKRRKLATEGPSDVGAEEGAVAAEPEAEVCDPLAEQNSHPRPPPPNSQEASNARPADNIEDDFASFLGGLDEDAADKKQTSVAIADDRKQEVESLDDDFASFVQDVGEKDAEEKHSEPPSEKKGSPKQNPAPLDSAFADFLSEIAPTASTENSRPAPGGTKKVAAINWSAYAKTRGGNPPVDAPPATTATGPATSSTSAVGTITKSAAAGTTTVPTVSGQDVGVTHPHPRLESVLELVKQDTAAKGAIAASTHHSLDTVNSSFKVEIDADRVEEVADETVLNSGVASETAGTVGGTVPKLQLVFAAVKESHKQPKAFSEEGGSGGGATTATYNNAVPNEHGIAIVDDEEVEVIDSVTGAPVTAQTAEEGIGGRVDTFTLDAHGHSSDEEETVVISEPIYQASAPLASSLSSRGGERQRWELRVSGFSSISSASCAAHNLPLVKSFSLARIGVVEARRRGMLELRYWRNKLALLSSFGIPLTRENVERLFSASEGKTEEVNYAQAKSTLARNVKFQSLHLLTQCGGGRNYFSWEVFAGNGSIMGTTFGSGSFGGGFSGVQGSFSSGIKGGGKGNKGSKGSKGGKFSDHSGAPRFELPTPKHPFQLQWALNPGGEEKEETAACWRNPVGVVVNAPSSEFVAKLQKWTTSPSPTTTTGCGPLTQAHWSSLGNFLSHRFGRLGVYSACYHTGEQGGSRTKTTLEGLTVLPRDANLLVFAFLRPPGPEKHRKVRVLVDLDREKMLCFAFCGTSVAASGSATASSSAARTDGENTKNATLDNNSNNMLGVTSSHRLNLSLKKMERINELRKGMSKVYLQRKIGDQSAVMRCLATLFDEDVGENTVGRDEGEWREKPALDRPRRQRYGQLWIDLEERDPGVLEEHNHDVAAAAAALPQTRTQQSGSQNVVGAASSGRDNKQFFSFSSMDQSQFFSFSSKEQQTKNASAVVQGAGTIADKEAHHIKSQHHNRRAQHLHLLPPFTLLEKVEDFKKRKDAFCRKVEETETHLLQLARGRELEELKARTDDQRQLLQALSKNVHAKVEVFEKEKIEQAVEGAGGVRAFSHGTGGSSLEADVAAFPKKARELEESGKAYCHQAKTIYEKAKAMCSREVLEGLGIEGEERRGAFRQSLREIEAKVAACERAVGKLGKLREGADALVEKYWGLVMDVG